MEVVSQVGEEHIVREGDPLERDRVWVSPEVVAARAGLSVEFGKHVPQDDVEDLDEELLDEED